MGSLSNAKTIGSVSYKPKNISTAGTYNVSKNDSNSTGHALQVVFEYPESAELEYINPLDDGDKEIMRKTRKQLSFLLRTSEFDMTDDLIKVDDYVKDERGQQRLILNRSSSSSNKLE